jgi:hypothetical protein
VRPIPKISDAWLTLTVASDLSLSNSLAVRLGFIVRGFRCFTSILVSPVLSWYKLCRNVYISAIITALQMFITKGQICNSQQQQRHLTAKKLLLPKLVLVAIPVVENYEDLAKLKKPVKKIVYMLPSKFKVEGLPYHLEFTLDIVKPKDYPKHGATFQITEFTRKQKSPAGIK